MAFRLGKGLRDVYPVAVNDSEIRRYSRLPYILMMAAGWLLALFLWLGRPPQPTVPAVPTVAAPVTEAGATKPVESALEPASPPEEVPESGEDPTGRRLELVFQQASGDPSLAGAALACVVLDSDGEEVYSSLLAETAMCPASTLKTLTTGAAFGLLGPDFRFETIITSSKAMASDGKMDGDLVIEGAGDPTLSSADLKEIAGALVAAGLKQLHGRVRADAAVFPEHPMSDHWNWGDIGNAYGAGAYGVNLDHNRFRVRFDPGPAVGAPARLLGGDPELAGIVWRNHVITGAPGSGDRVVVYSKPYGSTITLRGSIPAAERGFGVRAAIPNPPEFAVQRLTQFLADAGVRIRPTASQSGAATGIARIQPVVLFRHRSATVEEIVTSLHRSSDNLEAQCLFLKIGSERKMAPEIAVRDFWEAAGISFAGLRLLDGSGLARANMIRPIDLARVNLTARLAQHGERYLKSLHSGDGGNLRSKNGAMSGVRTEVGFLRRPDGSEWTFVLMANALSPQADYHPWRSKLLAAMGEP